MNPLTGVDTRRLSMARLQLADMRRPGNSARVALLAVSIAVAAALVLYFQAFGGARTPQLQSLGARNAALQAELARVRTELAIEGATRASLDRQVAELNERMTDLRRQVDFFESQSGRPRASHH
jgi:septal ring factor EnvC (AmiA/AmiB activator)